MTEEYLELTALLQNSVEIGQTSKGDWYIKSIKVYFGHDKDLGEFAVNKLFWIRDLMVKEMKKRG